MVSPSSNLPNGSMPPVISISVSGPAKESSASRPSARSLNRNRRLDGWMRLVALEREVLVAEAEDVLHLRIEAKPRQGPWRAADLLLRLLEMVQIEMGIAEGDDQFIG